MGLMDAHDNCGCTNPEKCDRGRPELIYRPLEYEYLTATNKSTEAAKEHPLGERYLRRALGG